MIKITEIFFCFLLDKRKEGKGGPRTPKNTLLHYHKIHFVLSNMYCFVRVLFENTIL